ncbi:hypothetical protein HZQ32_03640 [Elizabethkingia anophelis]|uniref:hypothetical protein n=1 Tax=Elizabethkingia anophelis TaxID=1117645 RepID=UPI0021A7CEA1|nr:hypothetical protein [Elizabethkingia anophelis]MCT3947624.1 hypothetical protein [Elizabethkingia anophelis]
MELIQKFWEFVPKRRLSTTAMALYLYLLKLANDNNGYDITVSDVVIGRVLTLTRKTIKSNKENLRDLGLIQYESKKGFSCSYRIILNYPLQIPFELERGKVKLKKVFQPLVRVNTEDSQLCDVPILNTFETIVQKNKILQYSKAFNIPTLEEFIEHACMLSGYDKSLDSAIEEKYNLWTNSDWRNNMGKPIRNWKSSLKNILPYMKSNTDIELFSVETIPNIKHPKPMKK